MASIAASMSFGGQAVAASDKRGLFLKVFSGEVMKAYERAIKITPFITQRTIASGKSAQFPTTGVAAARYFTPGDDLFVDTSNDNSHAYLSKIKQSERVIYIDELLTSACFIDDLDEAMSHYDYRTIFAQELGAALARHQDNYALYQIFSASKDVGTVASETTPGTPNASLVEADFYNDGGKALDVIYDCAAVLDRKDIPKEDRYVILNPDGYYNLLKQGVFTVGASGGTDARMLFDGGGNDYVGGSVTMVAGMPIIVTNANGITSGTDVAAPLSSNDGIFMVDTKGGDASTYADAEDDGSRNIADAGTSATLGSTGQDAIDTANCMAFVFHKSAVGMVKLRDITMESEYIIERQGTLMVAKLATGMGALRNDAAISVVAA